MTLSKSIVPKQPYNLSEFAPLWKLFQLKRNLRIGDDEVLQGLWKKILL
jgi:hypothetical protein